jgi:hypothetical protein
MTATRDRTAQDDDRQFQGEASNFANTARAQVTAFIDKLEAMVREGRDLIVDMDARLERFDADSRRLTETEKERRDNDRLTA